MPFNRTGCPGLVYDRLGHGKSSPLIQPRTIRYLHEAALAASPPSGTFYDPDHPTPVKRLTSLGVHEHWNNPQDKKYSRNLGTGNGIELVAVAR